MERREIYRFVQYCLNSKNAYSAISASCLVDKEYLLSRSDLLSCYTWASKSPESVKSVYCQINSKMLSDIIRCDNQFNVSIMITWNAYATNLGDRKEFWIPLEHVIKLNSFDNYIQFPYIIKLNPYSFKNINQIIKKNEYTRLTISNYVELTEKLEKTIIIK